MENNSVEKNQNSFYLSRLGINCSFSVLWSQPHYVSSCLFHTFSRKILWLILSRNIASVMTWFSNCETNYVLVLHNNRILVLLWVCFKYEHSSFLYLSRQCKQRNDIYILQRISCICAEFNTWNMEFSVESYSPKR